MTPLVDVVVMTDFPLDVGVRVVAEGPGRLRLSSSAGWMPPAYLGAINAVATGAGWYDETTADLISVALDNALVFREHLGWRPFPSLGASVEAGVGIAALGGAPTVAGLLGAATGREFPVDQGATPYELSATVVMIDVVLGWEGVIADHLVIRGDVGGAFTVGANVNAERVGEARFALGESLLEQVEVESELYLEETIRRYVHSPTLSLAVGWRFP